ncbi:MAG TPA: hypothetical protein VHI32_10565 [Burkholderiales bacterium]|jgi:hypothetical protein|nr:hypothetical protein [Burkholderiales bacterium]
MDDSRGLTITFMDGSKVSFGFPQQGLNTAAKQLKIEEFMKSPFLMVVADGTLMMFPVVNIKSIQIPVSEDEAERVRLPGHAIRNATLKRGEA